MGDRYKKAILLDNHCKHYQCKYNNVLGRCGLPTIIIDTAYTGTMCCSYINKYAKENQK
jgi:hypothetical protein